MSEISKLNVDGIDYTIKDSNARTNAQTALDNANNAQNTANTANTNASTALGNADSAQNTANTANSTANGIKTGLNTTGFISASYTSETETLTLSKNTIA